MAGPPSLTEGRLRGSQGLSWDLGEALSLTACPRLGHHLEEAMDSAGRGFRLQVCWALGGRAELDPPP